MSTSISTDRKRMSVDLLTPEGSVFSGQAWMVVAPSVSGELGILPRHQPIVAALRPGETRLKMLDDSQLVFATTTFFAQATLRAGRGAISRSESGAEGA